MTIQLMLYIWVWSGYRCCLFLRLFYLILELFQQCVIFCFSFHIYIYFAIFFLRLVDDDMLTFPVSSLASGFVLRGAYSFCCYWWNWLPSMFNLSFHKQLHIRFWSLRILVFSPLKLIWKIVDPKGWNPICRPWDLIYGSR